ncbi:hypothetical protein O0L34_g13680 [Tuta absoluta]|nr:hypothetical protein O0L34_g13680 [Tuta absoluta]
METEFDLKAFEIRYIAIAQCCKKIKQMFDSIMIVELFVNTPRVMESLWCMLVYIKEDAAWYSYTCEWLFAFHLTIQMCIPAVIGEMINCQMESIKLILNEKRIQETDREKVKEITRMLRYIKVRRLQDKIWRVIPVDLGLPLALLSLCTTYFIVILQFTHLYD